MCHVDVNTKRKSQMGQHKTATYSLEQILEAALYKTAAVWIPSSQLTNNLVK